MNNTAHDQQFETARNKQTELQDTTAETLAQCDKVAAEQQKQTERLRAELENDSHEADLLFQEYLGAQS